MQVETIEDQKRDGLDALVFRLEAFDCLLGICRAQGCPGGADLGGNTHGRGSAEYTLVLRGEGLAVCWSYMAAEWLPETVETVDPFLLAGRCYPISSGLGWHGATPIYDGQATHDPCRFLGGAMRCHYDVSFSGGGVALAMMKRAGSRDAVWPWLRAVFDRQMVELLEARHG